MAQRKPLRKTFFVRGRHLFDPCEEQVILRGISKMVIFDPADPLGVTSIPEVAKTGANCFRIVWGMANPQLKKTKATDLAKIIKNCQANKMIPVVGLWDFTDEFDGGFSKLQQYVNYWKQPAIVKLVKKFENSLIITIGNEAATGDENNDFDVDTFANAYSGAVNQLRDAGINVPIIIDGMDRGKSLVCFTKIGQALLDKDPLHNLLFSFHPYWPKSATNGTNFIDNTMNDAINANIPFIIGEISKFGAWAGFEQNPDGTNKLDANGNPIPRSLCSSQSEVEYMRFLTIAQNNQIGWILWEWGPGNADWRDGVLISTCTKMDATTDRTFLSLQNILPTAENAWLKDIILTNPISIQNTSVKSAYVQSGFKFCTV